MKIKTIKISAVILTVTFAAVATVAFAKDQPKSNYFRTSDDINIHYLSLGESGSYVILVHAYGANAEGNWVTTGIMQALAKQHRVIAIDCRNHGKSDKPNPNRFGIAQDVVELMDHLNINRAHLHGYSMGGGIVSQILLQNQDHLITASMGGSGIGESDPDRITQIPPDKLSSRAGQPSPTRPGPAGVLNVHIPVLAIVGEYDNPNEKTARMTREIPDFKKIIIRGRGHRGAVLDKKYQSELVKFINKNDEVEK